MCRTPIQFFLGSPPLGGEWSYLIRYNVIALYTVHVFSISLCMIISCFLSFLSMTVKVAQRMFTAPDTKPHSSLNGENLSRNFKYCRGSYQGSEPKSSKIQIMSTKGIWCQVFIDTVNHYQPLLTLDPHLNRHLIDISYYSWLTGHH